MAQNGVVAGSGRLTEQISIGVLAASVPRDAVDEAVAVAGRQARRSDGKLPPHVMVYFAMAMALFSDDDYEEVAARLAGTLTSWGCWDGSWGVPTSGGITQARQRLGHEPLRELFSQVAVPVAGQLTRGAFLGGWRLMAVILRSEEDSSSARVAMRKQRTDSSVLEFTHDPVAFCCVRNHVLPG